MSILELVNLYPKFYQNNPNILEEINTNFGPASCQK